MKDRIYVCHTFYHVYVSFLKEFYYRANLSSEEKASYSASIVLSKMSNDFGELKGRIEKTGFFEEVIEFDEKNETFFPELAKYKIDRGNIVVNMFYRIVFTSKLAKCLEPYVPVDFKKYKDIYVFCDSDPIGVYLNKKHIRYHAVEDGLDCLKTLDMARITNAGHFEMKTKFAALNLIFIENGYSKYCIDMEINDRSCLQYDYKKYIELPREVLFSRLTQEEKDILLVAFVENKEEIEERIKEAKGKGETVLILSDPLSDMETRKQIMDDLLETYGKGALCFIKPHPRDGLDYKELYPDISQFSPSVPMEMLNFFKDVHFNKVISVYTELGAIKFADEKIRLAHDFMDKYEPAEKHRHKI